MTSENETLAPMLDLIVMGATMATRASGGAVALLAGDGRSLTPISTRQGPDFLLTGLHPRDDARILDSLGAATTMASGGAGTTGRLSLLPIRLDAYGQIIGVLYVARPLADGPFGDEDVQILGIFARQAALAILQARLSAATLAEKNRLESMQSSFVSIVSHELQTPVAIIKAYAGTLAREDAPWNPETVIRVAHTIEEECDRLYRLITDLLDISRIQAGRVAMSIGPVDVPDLAETLAERSRTRAPNFDIRAEFPPDFPIITGDREKLRQALGNLVDNAIKYSPTGGSIVLGGRVEAGGVVISVQDQGIGIPREEYGRVFERFHRVDTSLSRSTEGVGLGLYITKTIVDAHGGDIWVESGGDGRGSTFSIRLPP